MQRDGTWDLFLETLWRYQYTDQRCALDDELRQVLYDESQGIADIAIKLFVLTQMRVIDRKYGHITAAAVRETAREHLRFVEPFLTALRINDTYKLEKDPAFEDLRLPNLNEAAQDIADRLAARPAAVETRPSSQLPPPPSSPVAPAAQDTGAESAGAASAPATLPCDVSGTLAGNMTDSDTSTRRNANDSASTRRSRSTGGTSATPRRRTHQQGASYQEGLLKALVDSRASSITPYAALKAAGYIRSAEEYLGEEAV